jgi:hypothetical protein
MFSKSLTKHFKGFGSGFTKFHAKPDADMLLNFSIHLRQNEKTKNKQTNKQNKLRGLSLQVNSTDRATATCRQSMKHEVEKALV